MRRTFTLPGGEKITTQTKSRYALIAKRPDGKPWIDKRSAYPGVLEGRIGQHRRTGSTAAFWIGDTETGELVYPRESIEAEQDRIEAAVRAAEASPFLRRDGFWLDEAGLADLAERYPVDDDHSAFLAIETALLGNGDSSEALIRGGCELAVELLANGDGEIDGYRMLIHPSSDLDDPWIAGHIERVIDRAMLPEPTEDDGLYDTAEIIRDATAEANRLLKWSER